MIFVIFFLILKGKIPGIPGITLNMILAKRVDFEQKLPQIRNLKIHGIRPINLTLFLQVS